MPPVAAVEVEAPAGVAVAVAGAEAVVVEAAEVAVEVAAEVVEVPAGAVVVAAAAAVEAAPVAVAPAVAAEAAAVCSFEQTGRCYLAPPHIVISHRNASSCLSRIEQREHGPCAAQEEGDGQVPH